MQFPLMNSLFLIKIKIITLSINLKAVSILFLVNKAYLSIDLVINDVKESGIKQAFSAYSYALSGSIIFRNI